MTTILLCCAALIVLLAALYLVSARPELVAGWLYRVLHDDDPWSWRCRLASRLLVIKHRDVGDPYPPEAADVPDPVDEQCTTAPRVVAGQDLDDLLLEAQLHRAYDDYRAGRNFCAGARHEPSPEVKQ